MAPTEGLSPSVGTDRNAAEPVDRHAALAVRSHRKAAVEMHCGIASEETVVSASPQLGRVFDFLVEAARASMHELVTQVFDFNGQFSTLIARNKEPRPPTPHSTVTDFARFRGLSTSVPRAQAV